MIKISTPSCGCTTRTRPSRFYTEKVGWEVRSDVTVPEMGNFRWLTWARPARTDIAVVLMAIPGPPVIDSETAGQCAS